VRAPLSRSAITELPPPQPPEPQLIEWATIARPSDDHASDTGTDPLGTSAENVSTPVFGSTTTNSQWGAQSLM
jgi:hypothetical protein